MWKDRGMAMRITPYESIQIFFGTVGFFTNRPFRRGFFQTVPMEEVVRLMKSLALPL